MWKERSELLPKYVSPIYKEALNTEKNKKKEENDKIEQKSLLYELKLKYAKEKINLPKISLILKKQWDKNNFKFNSDKAKKYKNSFNNNLNIKIKHLQNKNKSLSNNNNQNNNSISEINKNKKSINLIFRNIKTKNSDSFIKINNKLNLNNNIDNFLMHKSSNDINNIEEIEKNKFSKIKLGKNKEKNLINIKYRVELMENKYKRGKKLSKLKGGYINNEDFEDEMNDLLINSIKGKLDILEMTKSINGLNQ